MKDTVNFRGLELDIEFDATPYTPARMYLSNGDPGYPEEGGEFDITCVSIKGVEITELFDDNFDYLIEAYFKERGNKCYL